MVLRTMTNHENNLDKQVSWSQCQVDEGRLILVRFEPRYEYDLEVGGTTNGRLCPKAQSTLPDNLLTSSA
jgi:hypothetical protein